MPEGDTLRRLAIRINERLAGATVQRSVMRDPRLVGVDLAGRTLIEADAYGKHLFVRFGDGRSLHAHLVMTGSFSVGFASRQPEWKRRVELWFDDGRLTGESVPILHVLATADAHAIKDRVGPDLCAVVANLEPKRGMAVLPAGKLRETTRIAHAIADIANLPPDTHQAYAGISSFAHKAGLHASALKVNADAAGITDEDVAALRRAGLTDKGIVQLTHLVSDFASYNRLNLALQTDYDYRDLWKRLAAG